jgi:hypothetical protein
LPCGPAWVILFLSTSDGPATALHQQAAVASAAVVFFVGFVWRPFLGEGFAYSSAVDHGQIRSLVEPESGCLLRSKFQSHHATLELSLSHYPFYPSNSHLPRDMLVLGYSQPTAAAPRTLRRLEVCRHSQRNPGLVQAACRGGDALPANVGFMSCQWKIRWKMKDTESTFFG